MTATPKTITEAELAKAINGLRLTGPHNQDLGLFVHDPAGFAAALFERAGRNREPEYEPGAIYEDAGGHRYFRKPYATNLPWLLIGRDGLVVERVEGVPERPLRRLVPEGSQGAEVWWSSVLAALIAAEKHGEDMGQTAHRICRVLKDGSDD